MAAMLERANLGQENGRIQYRDGQRLIVIRIVAHLYKELGMYIKVGLKQLEI